MFCLRQERLLKVLKKTESITKTQVAYFLYKVTRSYRMEYVTGTKQKVNKK